MTRKDFLKHIQQHVAIIAIGTSTLRNLGKNTMKAARDYLAGGGNGRLDLTPLKSIEPSRYAEWLQQCTIDLGNKFHSIPASKRWGPARKALNIFLCHAYLNRFLAEAYCLDRLGDVMETPLDSRAAKQLSKCDRKGGLPPWKTVIELRIEKSNKYQAVAAAYADELGAPMRRACLDTVLFAVEALENIARKHDMK